MVRISYVYALLLLLALLKRGGFFYIAVDQMKLRIICIGPPIFIDEHVSLVFNRELREFIRTIPISKVSVVYGVGSYFELYLVMWKIRQRIVLQITLKETNAG